MREKEDLFNEFVGELHKKEKEERKVKKEKVGRENRWSCKCKSLFM